MILGGKKSTQLGNYSSYVSFTLQNPYETKI